MAQIIRIHPQGRPITLNIAPYNRPMSDEEFKQLCLLNPHLQIERRGEDLAVTLNVSSKGAEHRHFAD